jgi:hypothetical protein
VKRSDALNRLTNYGINGSSCTTGNTNSVKTGSYDSLGYDSEHNRLTQIEDSRGVTNDYLNDPVSNVMTEHYEASGVTTWRTYFVVDGKITAERFSSGSTVTMQYFILDHLGSVATIAAINPTTGAVTPTSQAYDAWGKMRVATTGADDMTCFLPPASGSTLRYTATISRASVASLASASRFSTMYSYRS